MNFKLPGSTYPKHCNNIFGDIHNKCLLSTRINLHNLFMDNSESQQQFTESVTSLNESLPRETKQSQVPNDTIRLLIERTTVRAFKNQPIDSETVKYLELSAQHAATSRYFNQWSAIKITDPELLEGIVEHSHQPFISNAPLLYIFLADQRRNADLAIFDNKGLSEDDDAFILNSAYSFMQAQNDAVFALHAMETAANSCGLGCVVLGSVINDPDFIIEALHLPKLVYPILGLAIGKPANVPAGRPRMPRNAQIFVDRYEDVGNDGVRDSLNVFDGLVVDYYARVRKNETDSKGVVSPSFTNIMRNKVFSLEEAHTPIAASIQRQGFQLDK